MNSEQQTKLTSLPVNKTVVFYSPIEGTDVLVRTGVLSEGSCFMNALLHGYSKDYIKMEKKERLHLVEKIRKSLSEKLDRKKWETVSNGLVAKIPFQDNIREILTDFYRHVTKNRSCKTRGCEKVAGDVLKGNEEVFQILCELVSLETLDKQVLAHAYDECADEQLDKCKGIIESACEKHLSETLAGLADVDKRKKQVLQDKFGKLISAVLVESDHTAYKTYLKNTKDVSFDVDSYTINLLSERFNRDIYFLDANTRMPYLAGSGEDSIKGRKSLIVIWLGGVHYEIVGRLLPGNRIQRDFDRDDPLVKRIRTFLYHPEKVASRYPNLVPYLDRNEKARLGLKSRSGSESGSHSEADSRSRSGSESDSRSDSRSDSGSDSHSDSESDDESDSGSDRSESSESVPNRTTPTKQDPLALRFSTPVKNTVSKAPKSPKRSKSPKSPKSPRRSKSPQKSPRNDRQDRKDREDRQDRKNDEHHRKHRESKRRPRH